MKTLTIIGAGDIAHRTLPLLTEWNICLSTREVLDLDAAVVTPSLVANLPKSEAVLYTAPPPNDGSRDMRLATVLNFWLHEPIQAPKHIVYISTTGVYGDCEGHWVDESAPVNPQSMRAQRRVDAEHQLQHFSDQSNVKVTILRAPGIYALERLPLQRIHDGVPILHEAEDAYSNHIHADDLAMICAAALNQPPNQRIRVYNACDDLPLKMGDWFSALAEAANLPVPPRCSKAELMEQVSENQWSFMRESRQLSNTKIKRELGIILAYPNVFSFLSQYRSLNVIDRV